MSKLPVTVTLAALALLTGCTPMASIQPLVEDKEAAAVDPAYLGLWMECTVNDNPDVYSIERSNEAVYQYRNLKSGDERGEIRLVKLDGSVFADIRPTGGVVPGHILARLRLDGDRLYLSFLREDEAQMALPHKLVDVGESKQVVLTPITSQLRQYLQKAPPSAFEEEAQLCRVTVTAVNSSIHSDVKRRHQETELICRRTAHFWAATWTLGQGKTQLRANRQARAVRSSAGPAGFQREFGR
jgi:hypothetical protein